MDIKELAQMFVDVTDLRARHREEESKLRKEKSITVESSEEARHEWEVLVTKHIVEELVLEGAVEKTAREILKGA